MTILRLLHFSKLNPTEPGHTCITLTSRGKRCKKPLRNKSEIPKLDIIELRSQIQKEPQNAYELLDSYVMLNLCRYHYDHKFERRVYIQHWAAQIDLELSLNQPKDNPTAKDCGKKMTISQAVHQACSSANDIHHNPEPFIPLTFMSTYRLWNVEDLLVRPLQARDLESGTLYIYTKPESPGLVKIGMTTQKLISRFSGVAGRCGYRPVKVMSVENVPHARRTEQLIFSELTNHRRRQTDCRCGLEHSEWFEIDRATAEETVRAWTTWMSAVEFYDDSGNLLPGVKQRIQELALQHSTLTAKILLNDQL